MASTWWIHYIFIMFYLHVKLIAGQSDEVVQWALLENSNLNVVLCTICVVVVTKNVILIWGSRRQNDERHKDFDGKSIEIINTDLLQASHPFAFNESQHLTDLNLSHNNVSTWDNRTFSTLLNLERLNLGYNLLEVIENVLFNNLRRMKMLNLNNNRLHRLPCQIFNRLKSIELLNLTENNLEEFNTTFWCIYWPKSFVEFNIVTKCG